MKKNRRELPGAAAITTRSAGTGGEGAPRASLSMTADAAGACAGTGDTESARHSLDFSELDHATTPPFGDDASITTTSMTTWSPSDLLQHDVLHEFIASWDEELFSGGAACQPTDDAGDAVHGRSDLVLWQAPNPMQSLNHDPSADVSASGSVMDASRADSSAEASNGRVTTPAAKPAAASKRKRIRRKVEITQLREETEALEAKYHELRDFLKRAAPSAPPPPPQQLENQKSKSLVLQRRDWSVIGKHEHDSLSASKLQNHKLRAEHQHQRKVAMQLHRLLVKNAAALRDVRRHFGASAFYVVEQQPAPNPQRVLAENLHIFQRMLLEIAPMQQAFARIQRIVRSREQQQQQQHHTFRDWQVREDSDNGLFVDVVDSYMMPFDRFQMNSGLRRFYGEENGASTLKDKSVCEYFLTTGDTFIRQLLPTYKDPKRVAPRVRLREVVRNYSDETQCVFLVVMLIEPVSEVTGEPLGVPMLCEKKWTVVRSDGAKSSIVQTYHKITRDAVHKDYESLWTRKMLAESMMPAWTASLSHVQRELEAVLIDQSVMTRRV